MRLPTTVCSVCWRSLCFESGCPPSFWSERKRHGAVSVCLSASRNVLEWIDYLSCLASDFVFGSSFPSLLRLHAGGLRYERSTQKGLHKWVSVQLPEDLVAHACRPQ